MRRCWFATQCFMATARSHRCAVAEDTPSFAAAWRTLRPRAGARIDSTTIRLGLSNRVPCTLALASAALTLFAIPRPLELRDRSSAIAQVAVEATLVKQQQSA